MAVTGVDIALWSISAAILIIYHLYFVIHAKKNPALFNIGVNLEARKKWLAEVMTTKGKEIVGVQTLRNGMMASSALATAAVTIGLFAMKLAASEEDTLRKYQYLSIGIIFFLSFINFAFTIRGFTHCTFLVAARDISPQLKELFIKYKIGKESDYTTVTKRREVSIRNLELDEQPPTPVPTQFKVDPIRLQHIRSCYKLMDRSTVHYTIGIRCYYLSIPLGLWILNSWAAFGGSIALVLFMWYSDTSV